MKKYFIILSLCMLIAGEFVFASSLHLNRLQILPTKSGLVIYLKLSQPLKYFQAFVLNNPARLVVDVPKSNVSKTFQKDVTHYSNPGFLPEVKDIRYGNFTADTTRVVMNFRKYATIGSYLIEGSTVLIFVQWGSAGQKSIQFGKEKKKKKTALLSSKPISLSKTSKSSSLSHVRKSQITIVLDPGHGGIDPGAKSIMGYNEKTFTLKFAKALRRTLIRKYHYKVILTRNKDVYIPLKQRYLIAEKNHADLFVSIHANHSPSKRVRGFSIYSFADRASDNSASVLASYENSSDDLAGIANTSTDSSVADILFTIKRHRTMQESSVLSNMVVQKLKHVSFTKILHHPHQFAHFVVLKSPTVPSVLLEMGFLSNRQDSRLMCCRKSYTKKMTQTLAQSIKQFIRKKVKT